MREMLSVSFSIPQNMKTRQMPVDRRIYLEVVRALGQAKVPILQLESFCRSIASMVYFGYALFRRGS